MELSDCAACKLSPHLPNTQANQVVESRGPITAEVLVVGEAPGKQEDQQGRAFVGKSGQTLEDLLESGGIDPANCRFTNVVHCWPPQDKKGKQTAPSKSCIETCTGLWLEPEIATVRPKLIVAVGASALKYFDPSVGIKEAHGQVLEWSYECNDEACQTDSTTRSHQTDGAGSGPERSTTTDTESSSSPTPKQLKRIGSHGNSPTERYQRGCASFTNATTASASSPDTFGWEQDRTTPATWLAREGSQGPDKPTVFEDTSSPLETRTVVEPAKSASKLEGKKRKHSHRVMISCQYHPAAGMHNPNLKKVIEDDYASIGRKLGRSSANPTWKLLRGRIAEEWLKRKLASTTGTIAFDFETTDLRPAYASVVGIAFCWREDGAVYLHIDSSDSARTMREVFAALRGRRLIAHNAVYELGVMASYGLDLPVIGDTMVKAALAGKEHLGLKPLALSELGRKMTPIEELIGGGLNMRDVDPAKVAPYASADASSTFALDGTIKLDKGSGWVYEEIEKPLLSVVARTASEGIALDRAAVEEAGRQVDAKEDEAREEVRQAVEPLLEEVWEPAPTKRDPERQKPVWYCEGRRVGPSRSVSYPRSFNWRFNPGSPEQVCAVLGTEDAEASTLDALNTPLAQKIKHYKHLAKLRSSYIEPIKRMGERAYGSFNPVGAGTGRFSASGWKIDGKSWGINLQTLPKGDEESKLIKRCFVADEGCVLVECDLSQIELRVAAHIAPEMNMQRAYNDDRDIHEEMMRRSGLDDRRTAKVMNFGLLYEPDDRSATYVLMSALASQGIYIDKSRAQELVAMYREAWPGLLDYYEDIERQVARRGYVETIFGRRLYLQFVEGRSYEARKNNKEVLRKAVNMPIQGTAADILKIAWYNMDKKGPEWMVWKGTKHDDLLVQVPEGKQREAAEFMVESMSNAVVLDVPVSAEAEWGYSWGDMEAIEV